MTSTSDTFLVTAIDFASAAAVAQALKLGASGKPVIDPAQSPAMEATLAASLALWAGSPLYSAGFRPSGQYYPAFNAEALHPLLYQSGKPGLSCMVDPAKGVALNSTIEDHSSDSRHILAFSSPAQFIVQHHQFWAQVVAEQLPPNGQAKLVYESLTREKLNSAWREYNRCLTSLYDTSPSQFTLLEISSTACDAGTAASPDHEIDDCLHELRQRLQQQNAEPQHRTIADSSKKRPGLLARTWHALARSTPGTGAQSSAVAKSAETINTQDRIFQKGMTHKAAGRLADSIASFNQLLELSQEHLPARLHLLDALLLQGGQATVMQQPDYQSEHNSHIATSLFQFLVNQTGHTAATVNSQLDHLLRSNLLSGLAPWLEHRIAANVDEEFSQKLADLSFTRWESLGVKAISKKGEQWRLLPSPPNYAKHKARPISFVVVKFSKEIDFNFYASACARDPCNQVIEIDNSANLFYDNLSRAIIAGVEQCTHELIVVVHEDVLLVDNWQGHLDHSLSELEKFDPTWGMVGSVGWIGDESLIGHWSDPKEYTDTFEQGQFFAEVLKLDEQILIFHRDRLPEWDSDLPGIHHIGTDLQYNLTEQGLATYVVNAPTIHKYADADGEILLRKKESIKIIDRSTRTYLADRAICDDYIRHKWPGKDIPQCGEGTQDLTLDCTPNKLDQLQQPIVVVSRGGSGSRLASLLTQDAGIFLGNEISDTQDSMEMVAAIYEGIIEKHRCHTQWQKEQIIPRLKFMALQVIKDLPPESQWGFKLPESILLLPEIAEAFPRARYIHFLRDPLTTCLRRPHMTARLDNHIGRITLPAAYDYLGMDRKLILQHSPADHMAYSTIHQLSLVREHLCTLPADRVIEIRFERALLDPAGELNSLCQWLGTDSSSSQIASAIDPQRSQKPKVSYDEATSKRIREILREFRASYDYID